MQKRSDLCRNLWEIYISVSFQYGNHPGFALAEAHIYTARVARPQVRWSRYCSRVLPSAPGNTRYFNEHPQALHMVLADLIS